MRVDVDRRLTIMSATSPAAAAVSPKAPERGLPHTGLIDTAIVVSNDRELRRPGDFVRANGATVIPGSPTARPGSRLTHVSTQHFVLRNSRVAGSQFADVLVCAEGRQIHRPSEWV